MSSHETFMRQALEEATKANGGNWPNPQVGAVIVKDGRVIGRGFHRTYGGPHAEVEAFENCSESPEGATLYVNLEPCCHTNKQTPPCAQRVVKEKIKKVVIANLDPNPSVNGKGVELLRVHGIDVETGVLADEGEVVNEVFFHAQRTTLPFVHLKLASTLDGKIALPSGESQWITGEKARAHVHILRSLSQAIIVGAETVRKDNPKLNVRLPNYQGKQPKRIVFTKSGELPRSAQLFTDELKHQTLIYTQEEISFDFPSAQVLKVRSLKEALTDLHHRKIIHLFLEGGSELAGAFMREGLVSRVSLFINPSFLGEGKSSLSAFGLKHLELRPRLTHLTSTWFDGDLMLSGRIN